MVQITGCAKSAFGDFSCRGACAKWLLPGLVVTAASTATTIFAARCRREFLPGFRGRVAGRSGCWPRASRFWPLKSQVNREHRHAVRLLVERQRWPFPRLPPATTVGFLRSPRHPLSRVARRRFALSPLLWPAIFRKPIRDRPPFHNDRQGRRNL